MKHKVQVFLITISSLLVLLAVGGYGYGVKYYNSHFFQNTTVNGVEVSQKDDKQAAEAIKNNLNQTKISIQEDGQVLTQVTKNDLETSGQTESALAQQMDKQNAWLWPLKYLNSEVNATNLGTVVSEKEAEALITRMGISNLYRTEATNAKIVAKEDGSYAIEDGKPGTKVIPSSLSTALNKAVSTQKSVVDLSEAYVQPDISKDEPSIKKQLKTLNQMADNRYVIHLKTKDVVIPKEVASTFYSLGEDGKVQFNDSKIASYLATVNQNYSGVAQSHPFKSTYSGNVTVQPGTLGWMIDTAKTTPLVEKALSENKDQTIDPVIAGKGYESGDAIGDSYVEVDIQHQVLLIYKNGQKVLEIPIVSGDDRTPTKPGAYQVWNKERNATLKGYDPKADHHYETPVAYWMPFDTIGQGLHDASWQPTFGGSWYHGHGSNGCINISPANIASVWNLVEVGTPVIIF